MLLERERKLVEAQVKDLHARLDEAENNALKVKTSTLTILVKFHTVLIFGSFMNHLHLYYANAHRYFKSNCLSYSSELKILMEPSFLPHIPGFHSLDSSVTPTSFCQMCQ